MKDHLKGWRKKSPKRTKTPPIGAKGGKEVSVYLADGEKKYSQAAPQ